MPGIKGIKWIEKQEYFEGQNDVLLNTSFCDL